jgi:hypothetical protein
MGGGPCAAHEAFTSSSACGNDETATDVVPIMIRRTIRALLPAAAVAYALLAIASVPVGRDVVHVSWRTVAVAAVSLAIMALRESWLSWSRLARRRRAADLWLAGARGGLIPAEHAWRAAELTSPHERRTLARGLRTTARAARARRPAGSVAITRPTVLPHVRALESLAAFLDDDSTAVAPAGVLAARRLLADPGSPLYFGEGDLGEALSAIRSKLGASPDRDAAASRRRRSAA